MKVPGPLAEKSYRANAVKEFCSAGVANMGSGLKAHHRALQSNTRRRG